MNNRIKLDDFTNSIAAKLNLDTEAIKRYIHSFFELIKNEVDENEKIAIHPFGTFRKKLAAQTERMNPRTREKITVPAHYKFIFTPMPATARQVNSEFSGLRPVILEEHEGEIVFPPDTKSFAKAGYSPELIREIRPSLLRKAAEYRALASSLGRAQDEKVVSDRLEAVEDESNGNANKKERRPRKLVWLLLLLLLIPLFGLGIGTYRYFSGRNRLDSAAGRGIGNEVVAEDALPEIEENAGLSETQAVGPEEPQTTEGQSETVQAEDLQETLKTEAEAQDVRQIEKPIVPATSHSVRSGDSFSLLAELYWDDMFLWPHLYAPNSAGYPDPDRLFPGNPVKIPPAPGSEDQKAVEQDVVSVYKRYKELILKESNPGRIRFRERNVLTTLAGAEVLYPGFLDMYGMEFESKDRIEAVKRASLGRDALSASAALPAELIASH